jgi:hypothetical protein
MSGYMIAFTTGNGGRPKRWHLVPVLGLRSRAALCGKRPGSGNPNTDSRWCFDGSICVTCPKCERKLRELEQRNHAGQ